jgi:hypothetical protein
MRCSAEVESNLETSLDIVHQLFTNIHRPPPLVFTRGYCSILLIQCITHQLYVIHVVVQPQLGETYDITVFNVPLDRYTCL